VYYHPQARLYPYLMVWGETSRRRQVDLRLQAGPGVTLRLWRAQGQVIKLSATVSYELALFAHAQLRELADSTATSTHLARGTLRLMGAHQLGHAQLSYEAWWQPALTHWANQRYHLEAALRLPIYKGLSFSLSALYAYDAVVPRAVRTADLTVLFGLSFSNQHKP